MRPFATDRTSSWNCEAVTSIHPSAVRRLKTAVCPASRALATTSSVRLPVVGIVVESGAEYSRTGDLLAAAECGHEHRGAALVLRIAGELLGQERLLTTGAHH